MNLIIQFSLRFIFHHQSIYSYPFESLHTMCRKEKKKKRGKGSKEKERRWLLPLKITWNNFVNKNETKTKRSDDRKFRDVLCHCWIRFSLRIDGARSSLRRKIIKLVWMINTIIICKTHIWISYLSITSFSSWCQKVSWNRVIFLSFLTHKIF